ncbi:MAG: hypothetical protein IJR87_08070, partial [Bacteroidaceae bacterium]|nr:hypothetical protein [Bacteroidaceae bacterium]
MAECIRVTQQHLLRFANAIIIGMCKTLTFLPQNIEQKISTFYKPPHKMKEQKSDLTDYRGLMHYPKTSIYTTLSPILGMFGVQPVLNNVKCVKNAIFENYFEQFYHFSTV